MQQETVQPFSADVGRVLDIVVHSLYRQREIFLRELVSNASDACDRLRWLALSQPELLEGQPGLRIDVVVDRAAGRLIVRDTGIGMDADELARNLGTIARSGTAQFLLEAGTDAAKGLELIGRFGVGFYSAFMVADRVEVESRRAGAKEGFVWSSDGRSGFTVRPTGHDLPRGTSVILHLRADAREFLDPGRVEDILHRYCDHIGFPVFLEVIPAPGESRTSLQKPRQVNRASALWTRSPSEIGEEQYREFYRHVAHRFDEPFARIHARVEGRLSWTALLFVPKTRPLDLFDPHRRHGVRLYVRRVFVTEGLDELLPRWLRFVVGVVDSEDLPLNVSRETLQDSAVVAQIRRQLVRRILDELERIAREDPAGFEAWWREFGAVVKEGLVSDADWRERILKLARFPTTWSGLTDLSGYVARMRPGQKAIYYLTGEDAERLSNHPQLEAARERGIEVLLLEDAVDPFWLAEVRGFGGHPFVSLARGEVDFSGIEAEAPRGEAPAVEGRGLATLIARLKSVLGEEVLDVRASRRLAGSAVCLVAPEGALDPRLERILREHGQLKGPARRILEFDPRHPLIRAMAAMAEDATRAEEFAELARLLLDQARVVDGEPLPDPGAFSRRLSRFLARAVGAAEEAATVNEA